MTRHLFITGLLICGAWPVTAVGQDNTRTCARLAHEQRASSQVAPEAMQALEQALERFDYGAVVRVVFSGQCGDGSVLPCGVAGAPGLRIAFELTQRRFAIYRRLTAQREFTDTSAMISQLEQDLVAWECLGEWRDAPQQLEQTRAQIARLHAEAAAYEQCTADPTCAAEREAAERAVNEERARRALADDIAALGAAICSDLQALRETKVELQAERRRGRRFGVVRLGEIADYGEQIEELEAGIAGYQQRYRRIASRRFNPRACQ